MPSFDPTQFGATPVATATPSFDPSSFGASPVDQTPSGQVGSQPSYLQNLLQTPQRIFEDYKAANAGIFNSVTQGANRILQGRSDFSHGNYAQGAANTALGAAGGTLGPAGNFIGAVFAPIAEIAKGVIPQTENETINAVTQGAGAGAALGGPVGALAGAGLGLGFHAVAAAEQWAMKQPKLGDFLRSNPDVIPLFNNALNVVASALGEKKLSGEQPGGIPGGEGGSSPARPGIMEAPISEVPGRVAENLANTAKAGGAVVAKGAVGASKLASILALFGTTQSTGLSPDTIKQIISNESDFSPSAMKNFTREGIANEAIGNINSRLNDLGEMGKAYQEARQQTAPVTVPKKTIADVLDKYGLNIYAKGKVIQTEESVPLTQGDVSQIQRFVDLYGKTETKTPNAFLNMRQATGKLANFQLGTSDVADAIGRDLYAKMNEVGRHQIPGLAELDALYSPERDALNQVKKDYFKSDGTLKDNAISKISNLTNTGRESVLARLENVSPGIGEKIHTLKAVEDIEAASGHKVGTYARAALSGGGLLTGNVPAIVAAVLSEPHIATKILRGYGKALGVRDAVLDKITQSFGRNSP